MSNNNTIQEIFFDLNPIKLRIISSKETFEHEDQLISVKFNINVPCQAHSGKYKMLCCFIEYVWIALMKIIKAMLLKKKLII